MTDHPPHPSNEPCPQKTSAAVVPGQRFGPLSKSLAHAHQVLSELSGRLRADHERLMAQAKAIRDKGDKLVQDFAQAAIEELGAVPDDVQNLLLVPEVVNGDLYVTVRAPESAQEGA